MNSLIDMLIMIPGPQFLPIFAGIASICIVVAWWWASRDSSLQYPLPEPASLGALDIAALRGGRYAVIEAVVFELWSRGLLTLTGKGKTAEIQRVPSDEQPGGPIHEAVYRFAGTAKKRSQLLRDASLTAEIETHLEPVYMRLDELHLLKSPADRQKSWIALGVALFVIAITGGAKLALGISRGKPVGFLIVLLAITLFILWTVLKPSAKISQLGIRYLKSAQKHFDWLRDAAVKEELPQDVSPALVMALFGVSALSSATLYTPYVQAFATSSSGGGGGGGGGCGDGGCGGGGCGGCGGCGG